MAALEEPGLDHRAARTLGLRGGRRGPRGASCDNGSVALSFQRCRSSSFPFLTQSRRFQA
eukprot:7428228-Lingulodinium_polyedra.AAC.1